MPTNAGKAHSLSSSSSAGDIWLNHLDAKGRLFYAEAPLETKWDDVKTNIQVNTKRGNLGRKAGLSEKLLGLKVAKNGAVEAVLSNCEGVQEGDLIVRIEGIPVQDRAGIEMTLSGISQSTQAVSVNLLRKSVNAEQACAMDVKQPADYPHLALYFHPGGKEMYKYPQIAIPLSAAYPTLFDALDTSFNSSACSTTIFSEGSSYSIGYLPLANQTLLCIIICDKVVPERYMQSLAAQLKTSVEFQFGESLDKTLDEDVNALNTFFSRFFHSIRSEMISSRSLSLPRFMVTFDSIRNKLDTVLFRYEAAEMEDGSFIRTFHITGSAVFHRGYILCSHLPAELLKTVFVTLRQERIFCTENIARVIVWRPVFLKDSEGYPTFLLVTSRGDTVLASLLEVNDFCVNDESGKPDPYNIDWAEENLTILRSVCSSITETFSPSDTLVVNFKKGFYVQRDFDYALWTVLENRNEKCDFIVVKKKDEYISCQTVQDFIIVTKSKHPVGTIEDVVKNISNLYL